MQKTVLINVIALMVLVLVACGGNDNEQVVEPTQSSAGQLPATATPEPEQAPTAEPTGEPTTEPVEPDIDAQATMTSALWANDWQWVSFTNPVESFEVEAPENYVLMFFDDGTFSLVADCNTVSGVYEDEAGSLSLEVGPATLAACPGDSRGEQFVQLLGGAARTFFEEGNLFIDLMADGGTMEFAPVPTPELTSTTWQWLLFTGNSGVHFDVQMPESYLLTFNEDGSLSVVADCNNAFGEYTTDEDGSLSITMGPATLAACPGDSRGEDFTRYLASAIRYFIERDNLYIVVEEEGGTMAFAPASTTAMGAIDSTLTANPWQWASFNGATEQFEVADPENYILHLYNDNTFLLTADCNVIQGDYFAPDDGTMAINPGPATLAVCPGDSRGEQLVELLAGAVRYAFEESSLYIELMADGGTLAFRPVAAPEADTGTPAVTAFDLCAQDALNLSELEATLPADTVSLLDDLLLSYVDQRASKPAPGASLLVITPEGRYYKAAGVANVSTCDPLPANALFEIGSNTKMMTAAIIYQLQEEGVLSTSDLMGEWLPEMAAIVPNSDQITIELLLTHTSGIYDYINGVAEDGPLYAGAEDKDVLTAAYTPQELVQLAVEEGVPYFEPGAEGQWTYSNTGYVLLGMIIEAATGQSYEANLQARIFEPLGLENIFLLNGQPEPGLLPQGYLETPFDYTTGEWNLSQGWSAGAVVADAEAMAALVKGLFSGELFQDPATVDLMLQPAAPGYSFFSDTFYYGHGMFYKLGLLGHGGQALGFQSDLGYLPGEDVTIVIWGNSAENGLGNAAVAVAQAMGLIADEQ